MKVWLSEQPNIVTWCPFRDEARLFAAATTPQETQSPSLTLSRFNFLGLTPTTETYHTFDVSSPITTLDWSVTRALDLGVIATGHNDGNITLYSPSEKEILSTLSYHKQPITCLSFNRNQTNVLLSISSDNTVSIWDLTNPKAGKRCSSGITNRVVQGEITAVSWHPKSSLSSIFGLCDSTGLCVVWDLRSNRSTHSFADSTFKSSLSDIAFSPSNSTLLATASNDSRNSVISLWDLRNITEPYKKLHGHSSGVSKLEWPSSDSRILISGGKDGNIISWNIETGEQLSSIFESTSAVTHLSWSPFIHGALLASSLNNTQLYSFADPTLGQSTKLPLVKYHQRNSGVDVAFDGRIFHFHDKTIRSFIHQEQIAEADDFVNLIDALEKNNMEQFVNDKIQSSEDNTEKELWEITQLAMNSETFKSNALKSLGFEKKNFSELMAPIVKPNQSVEDADSSSNLFGNTTNDIDNSIFGGTSQADAEVFGDVFSPFRVLPKAKDDKAANLIAQAIVTGNLEEAINCAFNSEKYADALLIASCGSSEIFEAARQRYIRLSNTPLTRLISQISENKLDNLVRYAKIKDWKEIFAILCNHAKDQFESLSAHLGRRLIAEQNDYKSALLCFIAAKQYDMIQQCLFQIYEKTEKDTSSASVVLLVLEKLCAMVGPKAGEVVSDIARTFLQHVIQSGHKDDAIRFVDALPDNKSLLELKAALKGDSLQHQQTSKQVRQQQPSIPSQNIQNVTSPSNVFIPNQRHAIPVPPTTQQQSNLPPPPPTTTHNYIPNNKPPIGPPPTMNNTPPPPQNVPTYQVPNGPNVSRPTYVVPNNTQNIAPPPMTVTPTIVAPPTINVPPPTVNVPLRTTPPPGVGPTVVKPPPTITPVINAPPPAVIKPPIAQVMPVTQPPPQPTSPPISPPPMAPPVINAPPPVHIIPPQVATPPMNPAHSPSNVATPEQKAQPVVSNKATIEEVPQQYQSLANSIVAIIDSIESKPDITPQVKKAIQDAQQKLPYVYAAFKNETVPEELIQNLSMFVQQLNSGDVAGAGNTRKNLAKFMSKSRDVVMLMIYIQNALK
ncbi:protein transport protein SEC31 B [Histomonas meleagridis]|uniref:protein transport protein SEC31-like B n=1 Tax=Histomonas meleagridis TaxID=135588 RepID=UPI00355973FE|nr:protein transport protein SEC31 B [Histomonas meleagridis]KAH0806098.1 protein transport protein SEC31-like B [Histomonas meleagridis]